MKNLLIKPNLNIKNALKQMTEAGEKCLVVVNSNNILKGTLTDGDIRRAILRGADINSKIGKYIKVRRSKTFVFVFFYRAVDRSRCPCPC